MSLAPEPPLPSPAHGGTSCHACAAPLAPDARYCLECGARRGAGGPIDFALLFGERTVTPIAARSRPALPGAHAPVAAVMVLALLVTGIGLGSLGSPNADGAAAQRYAIAVAPPPASAAAPAVAPATPIVPVLPPPPPPAASVQTQPAVPGGSGDATTTTDGTGASSDDDATNLAGDKPEFPPVEHVFVIMLAEQSRPSAFAKGSGAPYLSETLVGQGTLLSDLHTVSPSGLANSIALLSGQAPNPQTAAGCPTYTDVTPGTVGKDDQETGEGCVYSVQTATLPNQLDRAERTWRAYLEDQGNGGAGVPATCRHPALGAPDPWRDARPGDAYATARNPFVYFHAITDSKRCADNVVGLDKLQADLALAADKAPTFSYIAPNLCHDGRATPCAEGAPAGPAAADAFLAELMPKIRASKGYQRSLVIVTFDHLAPLAAPTPVATPAYPSPPDTQPPGATGGEKVGALLLSPFTRKGRRIVGRRDTYSLLATIQRVLALDPLGNAARSDAKPFGPGLFDTSK